MAKSAPYPPCTGTAYWLKFMDTARMLRQVTQPPHIAGPLGIIGSAQRDNFLKMRHYLNNYQTGFNTLHNEN